MSNYDGYYQQMPQPPAYGRPAYPAPAYQQPQPPYRTAQPPFQQQMQTPMMQDSMPQIRFVSSREEAVAATVLPGMPCYFVNRVQDEIYYKAIDPQSGVPVFEDYGKKQPEQPQQYVTVSAFDAFRQEIERCFASLQPRQNQRKAVTSNDE